MVILQASTNRLSTTNCPFHSRYMGKVYQRKPKKKTTTKRCINSIHISIGIWCFSLSQRYVYLHTKCVHDFSFANKKRLIILRLKITLQLLFIACGEREWILWKKVGMRFCHGVCVLLSQCPDDEDKSKSLHLHILVPLTRLINTKSVFKIHNYVNDKLNQLYFVWEEKKEKKNSAITYIPIYRTPAICVWLNISWTSSNDKIVHFRYSDLFCIGECIIYLELRISLDREHRF